MVWKLTLPKGVVPKAPANRSLISISTAGARAGARNSQGLATSAAARQANLAGDGGAPVVWATVPEDCSMVTEEGMTDVTAPVLYFNKQHDIFQYTTWIMGELVPDSSLIVMKHDDNGTEYPELSQAIAEAGGEENCWCIAFCPQFGRWGVGAAGGWKPRENAAKLALAISLLSPDGPLVAKAPYFAKTYPSLRKILEREGLLDETAAATLPASAYGAAKFSASQEDPAKAASSVVGPTWCTLTEESQITEGGYPAEAPVVMYVKGEEIFSYAHGVLQEIIEDVSSEVQFEHDTEWNVFPEVGAAIREANLPEASFCVAMCPNKGKWGIGCGSGWKFRETAAKLALAVALCSDDQETLDSISGNTPIFRQFVDGTPQQTEVWEEPPAKKSRVEVPVAQPKAKKDKRVFPSSFDMAKAAGITPAAVPSAPAAKSIGKGKAARKKFENALPRDAPLWVQLPAEEEMPELLSEMPQGSVAACTDDVRGSRMGLYHNMDKVLAQLVSSIKTDIKYVDDVSWTKFPQVGAALSVHGDEEVPMTVAICSSGQAWGVGLGASKLYRLIAAKAALGASLVLRQAELGELPDLQEFPDFEEFVGQVQVADS